MAPGLVAPPVLLRPATPGWVAPPHDVPPGKVVVLPPALFPLPATVPFPELEQAAQATLTTNIATLDFFIECPRKIVLKPSETQIDCPQQPDPNYGVLVNCVKNFHTSPVVQVLAPSSPPPSTLPGV
jgi:hypothetical protein